MPFKVLATTHISTEIVAKYTTIQSVEWQRTNIDLPN